MSSLNLIEMYWFLSGFVDTVIDNWTATTLDSFQAQCLEAIQSEEELHYPNEMWDLKWRNTMREYRTHHELNFEAMFSFYQSDEFKVMVTRPLFFKNNKTQQTHTTTAFGVGEKLTGSAATCVRTNGFYTRL
ncbi:hypothetical protein EBU99_15085 [bacterium]|nr:hypothetical protein [bacterium]